HLMLRVVQICNISFFFFQAEDGIRDDLVTGVQTCALPICIETCLEGEPLRQPEMDVALESGRMRARHEKRNEQQPAKHANPSFRSEERRVGKEGSTRWSER